MNIMQVLHKGSEEATEPPKILCLPYVRGLSEKVERVCTPLGVKAAFRPMRTLRQALVKVKTPIPEEKKKGVMYEVPCKDCHRVHIGVTKRTQKVRLGEHNEAVRRGDPKNTGKLKDPGLFGIRLPVISQRGSSINPQKVNG